MRLSLSVLTGLLIQSALGPLALRADFIIYKPLRFGFRPMVFEGEIIGGTNKGLITIRHPQYGDLQLPKKDCQVFKSPNHTEKFRLELKAANKEKRLDDLWKLAKDSVRYGLPGNYYRAAEILSAANPNHPGAQQALRLAALLDVVIPETPHEEEQCRKRADVDMIHPQFARSRHFILMHNLRDSSRKGESKVKGLRRPSARQIIETRLENIEKVYLSFFAFFWSRGYEIPPPKERMFVVLFDQESDFKRAIEDSELAGAVGFYHLKRNVSYFFEFRNSEGFGMARQIANRLRGKSKTNRASFGSTPNSDHRAANALDFMVEIMCEQQDVATISHEIVHQLGVNTGLTPSTKGYPLWAMEGLAQYFESPRNASWSGVGAINDESLEVYRKTSPQVISSGGISFVVSDGMFDSANRSNTESIVSAYAHAWALTHFLMENHFEDLMKLYKQYTYGPDLIVGTALRPEVHRRHFDQVFKPENRKELQKNFDSYMRSMQTDLEKLGGFVDDD